MKITAIHSTVVPIASEIRNAYIDFSKMTASVVAAVTDVVRDGKRVVGYGFNSNGRYAQAGLLAERFIPRIMQADPASLLDDEGTNLNPSRIWALAMANEKPGGHGERSVAIGVLDMAVWDAVAKIEGKPLYRLLADRYNEGKPDDKVFVYAAGGYYYPGKNVSALQDEMRKYVDLGYSREHGTTTFPALGMDSPIMSHFLDACIGQLRRGHGASSQTARGRCSFCLHAPTSGRVNGQGTIALAAINWVY